MHRAWLEVAAHIYTSRAWHTHTYNLQSTTAWVVTRSRSCFENSMHTCMPDVGATLVVNDTRSMHTLTSTGAPCLKNARMLKPCFCMRCRALPARARPPVSYAWRINCWDPTTVMLCLSSTHPMIGRAGRTHGCIDQSLQHGVMNTQ